MALRQVIILTNQTELKMEGVNNKYNFEIEVLSPLSIGAGAEKDWVRGVDFVVEKSRLYRLNLKKLVANGVKIDDLTTYFAKKDEAGIKSRIAGKLEEVSDFSMPFPAETDNDIKSFTKNQLSGRPVLAGSSFKGALRSILFDYLGGNAKNSQEVFGSAVKGDEFMRFIKISDAEFDGTNLVNTKIFNLQNKGEWIGGWKHQQAQTTSKFSPVGFNTLYECLMPGQVSFLSIMTSAKMFDNIRNHVQFDKKRAILANDISFLFGIINNHTKDYLTKEKTFFEKYNTDKTAAIIESINKLLKMIPSDNSYCIMKMSAGSGFHSITGDWQFDDFANGQFDRKRADKKDLFKAGSVLPKSRKIALHNGQFSLMGFVKLRAISDEDFKTELKKQESIRLAKIEENKRQAEAILQADKLQKEKEEKYKSLVTKAQELYESNDIENAQIACEESAKLCPNLTHHKSIKELIELKIKQMEADKQAKIAAQQAIAEQEQRKADRLAAGLSFLLEKKVGIDELKISELSNGVGRINQFLKKNADYVITGKDKNAVGEWLKLLPKPTKKADKREYEDFSSKSWKFLINIFSDNIVTQWFNEFNSVQ